MSSVLRFDEVDETSVAVVGGKGAHLGRLSRIPGIVVPPGFCITTAAFPAFGPHPELKSDDRDAIRAWSAELRGRLEAAPIPAELEREIVGAITRLGAESAFAVRSSATAEDSPTASFAGQHDTYLDVVGIAAILESIRRCWASLFTERAVTYRLRNGLDHRTAQMGVVVQRMVPAQAAGTLFTADPVSGNRKVACVEAVFGLGEALVSGRVNPDVLRVREGRVISRQGSPVLTEAQVLRLVELGRLIEAHLGQPQDLEWCLSADQFQFVQSRPITTLFPIPNAGDPENRVYLSVGHQQMMTDAMKPLGLSVWQLTAAAPMHEAGGRLFVDVTRALGSPAGRAGLMALAGKSDPFTRNALETVLQRDFIKAQPQESAAPARAAPPPLDADPTIVRELIERSEASMAVAKRELQNHEGTALFDFILSDLQELKRLLFEPKSYQVIIAAVDAAHWLIEHLQAWLGDRSAADVLMLSIPGNVTAEMGLALLEVADVLRPKREVIEFLRSAKHDRFLEELARVTGGAEAREAIAAWLEKYGMRGVGEIDLTRPRWSERPAALLPLLLGHVESFAPGEGKRRFEQGLSDATKKEAEVLQRLRALPDGESKAAETKRNIDRVRAFMGYREFPKYVQVSRYFLYKQALLKEADRLVQRGVLREKEDAFFLTFRELHEAVRTGQVDAELIRRRREAFRSHQALTPPRVLTSEGECLSGEQRREDVPSGALVGLPVSAGTVEGRARIVHDLAAAELAEGDILVTSFTDPSWTPLFVAIKGLVTEVGGMMTHGSVIAREYGLPAVVAVSRATQLIRDGQRIRVNGTDGYVELLD